MTDSTGLPARSGSPFDAIMLPGERWSARDLMPLLGYPRWQDFTPAIDRAKTSAAAQGFEVMDLFRVSPEKSGGRPRADFHLSRFACCLVAMNGDPRKPEVAAVQVLRPPMSPDTDQGISTPGAGECALAPGVAPTP